MERDLIINGVTLVLKAKGIGRAGMKDIVSVLIDGGVIYYIC